MATLTEVLNGFKDWGQSWKARAQAAEAQNVTLTDGLTAAQTALADKAAELQGVLDNDAADDVLQISQAKADQAQADADAAQAALDDAKAADLPPADPQPPVDVPVDPPIGTDPNPPVDPGTPPATDPPVDPPVVDPVTDPPVDPSGTGQ